MGSCGSQEKQKSDDKLEPAQHETTASEKLQEKQKSEFKLEPAEQETANLEEYKADPDKFEIITKEKYNKMKRAQQEIVQWHDQHLLGLKPNLWMEVLDNDHRQGSVLYPYWQRWEKSNTELGFFHWLDNGPGSFIDLPEKPRRLLDEWKIKYLTNEERKLFKVSINDGLFTWDEDKLAVTVPGSLAASKRQQKINALVEKQKKQMKDRDGALLALKETVEMHLRTPDPEPPVVQTLCEDPNLKGLLWQLRDEHFEERLEPPKEQQEIDPGLSKYNNQKDFREGDNFLEDRTWDHVYTAVLHDLCESKGKKDVKQERREKKGKPVKEKTGAKPEDKGIFVVDKYDNIYCYTKERGIIQHSSFVRGHSVKFAGGLRIEKGQLLEIRPHSGHYRPDPESLKLLEEAWKKKGVNYDEVEVKPFEKEDQ